MCFSSLAFATGVNAFGTAVRLDSRFSLPVAIRPVQFGGGRRRTPPLAFWLVAPGWLSYRGDASQSVRKAVPVSRSCSDGRAMPPPARPAASDRKPPAASDRKPEYSSASTSWISATAAMTSSTVTAPIRRLSLLRLFSSSPSARATIRFQASVACRTPNWAREFAGEGGCVWHPAIGDHVPRRALHFVSQTVCEPSIVGQRHFLSETP